MSKISCLFILSILLCQSSLFAQVRDSSINHHFSQYVHIGYNVGGLAPVPLPNNIRKIEHFSPGFSPSVGYELSYKISNVWHLNGGVRFDIKGMNITDSVQYMHTFITIDSSAFEGDFTGTNKTICKNAYLSVPITAVYSATGNWKFKLGAYAAYLINPSFSGNVSNGYIRKGNSLGEKVVINIATFNFDNEQRRFDWGLVVGTEKRFLQTFALSGELQWGMRPVFPASFRGIDFKMTNIFFTLGVRKKLFD